MKRLKNLDSYVSEFYEVDIKLKRRDVYTVEARDMFVWLAFELGFTESSIANYLGMNIYSIKKSKYRSKVASRYNKYFKLRYEHIKTNLNIFR